MNGTDAFADAGTGPARSTGRTTTVDGIRYESVEVVRPAALLSESAARQILAALAQDDVRTGGHWLARPGIWQRYDGPWASQEQPPDRAGHLGTISCVYDSPQRFMVTVFRVSMTPYGVSHGWTVDSLCDDALRYAGLTLDTCPRVDMLPAPRRFTG